MPFISLNNIFHSYNEGAQKTTILNGANLTIHQGETVAILGRSGSGKSTLLNLMAGIDQPNKGEINIDNQNLISLSEHKRTIFRRFNIGYVYQSFNLIDTLTASENIALSLELTEKRSNSLIHKVDTWLRDLNLHLKGRHYPDQLSGGEQQRVAIARALIHKPKVVLADEPTGNLDAETGHKVLSLLHQAVNENNTTLIIVTHSLAVAKTADRVLTLDEGTLSEQHGSLSW